MMIFGPRKIVAGSSMTLLLHLMHSLAGLISNTHALHAAHVALALGIVNQSILVTGYVGEILPDDFGLCYMQYTSLTYSLTNMCSSVFMFWVHHAPCRCSTNT